MTSDSDGDPTRFLPPLRGDLAAAKEVEVEELEDFTAEHVALVVPPVDHKASRHLRQLVVGWEMLADLSFSDLLLYVGLPSTPGDTNRFLVVNQVRPNTGQTLFVEDMVGRTVDAIQRPLVANAAESQQITEGIVDSEWLGTKVKVTAVPVVFRGSTIGVMAKESALSMSRPPGGLATTYLEIFDRLCLMVSEGTFPFEDEEVLSAGAPRVGDGVALVDSAGRVTFASPNAVSSLRRLGATGPIQGELASNLGPGGHAIYRAFFTARPAIEDVEHGDTAVVSRCIPLLVDRKVDGALVLMRDVSELRSRDRLLISKDATIREIHHRVKNNLQTISSLLRLQGRRLSEPSAKAAIEESVRRIGSIALVHETLSRKAGDEVDLDAIVRPLARMVEEGLTSPERPLKIEIVGAAGKLASPEATSLAVVLTELLQNVMDHAYPPGTLGAGEPGLVRVELTHDPDNIVLVVRDDGVGPPEGEEPDRSESLGLSIVRGLVSDLQGTIEFGPGGGAPPRPGTQVVLRIPVMRAA